MQHPKPYVKITYFSKDFSNVYKKEIAQNKTMAKHNKIYKGDPSSTVIWALDACFVTSCEVKNGEVVSKKTAVCLKYPKEWIE